MRRTLTLCRTGLSAAAALVLLTACGGSDEESTASSSTSESSPGATESSAAAEPSEFCTEAAAIQERVGSTFTGSSDLSNLGDILQETAQEIRALEPPAELAADWSTFAEGIEQIAAVSQIDFNDPNAVAQWQQQAGQLQAQYGTAFTNVQNYLTQECGFDDPSTDPAPPTS